MALLNDEIVNNVKEMLSSLTAPVQLAVFTDDQQLRVLPANRTTS